MDPKKPTAVLHAPEQAIDSYLAALLSEVEAFQEAPPQTVAAPVQEQPKLAQVVEIRQGVHSGTAVAAAGAIEFVPSVDTEIEAAVEAPVREAAEIVPEWGRSRFQCLPFRVRGMNLVVPLTALCSITEWDRDLTQIPGQPDWHMGVLVHRERNVVVIDTAQLIMPDRLEKRSEQRPRGSHVLMIGDGRWGLACDSLQSPLTLEQADVRWRRGEGYRSWMAGTVIEQLSVLLNVDALLEMAGHR
jgi:purine-binding chemotaxis protein CheW